MKMKLLRALKILIFAEIFFLVFLSRAATTNSLSWKNSEDVSADIRGEPLMPLLENLTRQNGWQIFVEPGAARTVDAKFSQLPANEALKKLLGDLNFALVPKTNAPSELYIFITRMENATRAVKVLAASRPKAKYVANELIVKLNPGGDIAALAKMLGAKIIGRDDKLGIYRLRFDDPVATDAALGRLQNNADVADVDYNYIYDAPPGAQKLDSSPVGPVSLTLNPPSSSGRVIVGLVDTSIQSLGTDLDKFILKSQSVADGSTADEADPTHATGMAETILRAMSQANGGGTSAQILPVDVYGANATTTSWNVALGIQAAVDGGATAINLSLGSASDSPVLDDLIEQAEARGIVFFAAAGNQPVNSPTYPAAVSGVIAVAATQGGQLASYSNFGSFIAIALPGSSVIYLGGQAYVVQGTSTATAYATGVAAGTKSGNADATWAQILAAMQKKFPVPKN